MQGQAGPFEGCPPRSRSAAQMDGCPRQNPAYRPATEKPRARGAFLCAGPIRGCGGSRRVRTCVRMSVICVLLPRFALAVALSERSALLREPAALAPEPGRE